MRLFCFVAIGDSFSILLFACVTIKRAQQEHQSRSTTTKAHWRLLLLRFSKLPHHNAVAVICSQPRSVSLLRLSFWEPNKSISQEVPPLRHTGDSKLPHHNAVTVICSQPSSVSLLRLSFWEPNKSISQEVPPLRAFPSFDYPLGSPTRGKYSYSKPNKSISQEVPPLRHTGDCCSKLPHHKAVAVICSQPRSVSLLRLSF
ncbi:hypothetical protein GOP47_0028580, partial [Adiantum capillus-veneris]